MKELKINKYWHQVRSVKDMPKKTDYYLMLTNIGWPLTFYWDAHSKRAWLLSSRNHYDSAKNEYINDGKVDSVRIGLRNPGFVWGEVPKYYLARKEEIRKWTDWYDAEMNKAFEKIAKKAYESEKRALLKNYGPKGKKNKKGKKHVA